MLQALNVGLSRYLGDDLKRLLVPQGQLYIYITYIYIYIFFIERERGGKKNEQNKIIELQT